MQLYEPMQVLIKKGHRVPGAGVLVEFAGASGEAISRIDALVGERVRIARRFAKLTQKEAGELIGVSGQQMHKFEAGVNRISAARLWILAQSFEVPVQFFFESMTNEARGTPLHKSSVVIDLTAQSQIKAELLKTICESDDQLAAALSELINRLTNSQKSI